MVQRTLPLIQTTEVVCPNILFAWNGLYSELEGLHLQCPSHQSFATIHARVEILERLMISLDHKWFSIEVCAKLVHSPDNCQTLLFYNRIVLFSGRQLFAGE